MARNFETNVIVRGTISKVGGTASQFLKADGSVDTTVYGTGTVTSVTSSGGYGGLTLTGSTGPAATVVLGGTPTGTWPITITGNSATASSSPRLSSNMSLLEHPGTGLTGASYAITAATSGLFPAPDNSNYILTINRHSGEYNSQLGFSSNGNMYYRSFSNTAINTTQPWRTIWDSATLTNLNQLINGPGYTSNTGTVTSVGQSLTTTGTDITLTISGTATVNPTVALNIPTASASVRGALSASDWTTFNNKQPAGSYLTGTKVDSFNTRTGAVTLLSSDVTTALGFTPYNSTNPSGYITSSASITGAARRIEFIDGPRNLSDRLPNTLSRSVNFDFVSAGVVAGTGSYGGVMTFSPWDGTTTSTGDSSYQLAFANRSGSNASGVPDLKIRNGIDATWSGTWHTFLHSGNFSTIIGTKVDSFNTRTGAVTLTSTDVTTALGYTPLSGSKVDSFNTRTGVVTLTAADVSTATNFSSHNSSNPIPSDAVSMNQIGYVNGVSLLGQTDGGLYNAYHSAPWHHQIYGDFRTGQIVVRGKNSGTWQAWRTVWDSVNLTNLNQLTNGPGYITGYTETDTLTSVVGRGNTILLKVGIDLNFGNAAPTISLAIGDYDTGFNALSDGNTSYVSNGVVRYNMNNVIHSGNIGSQSVNYATSAGNTENITSNPNRTDVATYPVVWSNGNATSPNYSCAAVNIQSSTGKLTATSLKSGTSATGCEMKYNATSKTMDFIFN